MKKANVNLFDKNKVQVKLLKNKALRISDGRKNPTKIVNLRKTGITIWTDGKHLKIFRGNLLTEVIGRSVYRANKFQTVEFMRATDIAEKRTIAGNGNTNFVGASNVAEGLISVSNNTNFVGASNVAEGLIGVKGTANFVGASNVAEGRRAVVDEDILIIGARDASEARSLGGGYAIYINIYDKSAVVRQGNM